MVVSIVVLAVLLRPARLRLPDAAFLVAAGVVGYPLGTLAMVVVRGVLPSGRFLWQTVAALAVGVGLAFWAVRSNRHVDAPVRVGGLTDAGTLMRRRPTSGLAAGLAICLGLAGCSFGDAAKPGAASASRPESAMIVFSQRGQLRVADPSGMHPAALLPPGYSIVGNLFSVSDDGSTLAVVAQSQATSTDALWVTRGATTREVAAAPGVVTGLSVSADGTAVYLINDAGALTRWDVASGTLALLCPRCGRHARIGSQAGRQPGRRNGRSQHRRQHPRRSGTLVARRGAGHPHRPDPVEAVDHRADNGPR